MDLVVLYESKTLSIYVCHDDCNTKLFCEYVIKNSKVASSLIKIASNYTFKRQNTFLGLVNVKSLYTNQCRLPIKSL